jgi:hypothetical protein
MAIGNLKYARPSDIITSGLTWSAVAGTVSTDPDYGLAALYDRELANPCKFIDDPVIAIRLVGDAGVATRIDGLALPNSNIDAALVMRAELNATNVWTAPTVSVNMTMGARKLDGHRASPWADFTTASGYSAGGFRYVSLYVPINSVAPWLGELPVFSRLRTFSQWPQFGTRAVRRPFPELLKTEYGVKRGLRRRISQRAIRYSLKGNATDYDDLQALADDAGPVVLPWFCVADSSIKTDGGLYGRFTEETAAALEAAEEYFDLDNLPIDFEEDSRSIPF